MNWLIDWLIDVYRRHQAGNAAAQSSNSGSSGGGGAVTSSSSTNRSGGTSNSSSNANSNSLFPRGPNSVSSLVRLALSSNFPGGLLSTAQSYPSLSNTLSSLSAATSNSPAIGLGQALSMSMTSSDSEQVPTSLSFRRLVGSLLGWKPSPVVFRNLSWW